MLTRTSEVARDLLTAVVLSLAVLGHAIGFALLVFAGELSIDVPRAIAAFGLASGVAIAFAAWRSSVSPNIPVIQDGPGVILIVVAASIGVSADGSAGDVFVMLAIGSALAGIIMYLVGAFRLGGLARYIPDTVVAAFLGGTGYLLVRGGVEVMIDRSIVDGGIGDLFASSELRFWVPGCALGVLMWFVGKRVHPVMIAVTAIVATAVFYGVVAVSSSVGAVEADGWLIGPFSGGTGVALVSSSELTGADWSAISGQSAGIAGAVVVAVLIALLNYHGFAYATQRKVDADREMRAAGLGGFIVAPLGVVPTFTALSDSLLAHELGVRSRRVPLLTGAVTGIVSVFAIGALGYLPRLVIGSLLLLVGIGLLVDWVSAVVRELNRVDQVLGVGIVGVIVAVGILEGIAVGVLAACAVFVVRSSQLNPIRRSGDLALYRSRVDRPAPDAAFLLARSSAVAVVELQGHLFFGSLTTLEERMVALADESIASDDASSALVAVVVDFRSVTGLDSSASAPIATMVRTLRERSIELVFSALDPQVRAAWNRDSAGRFTDVVWLADLDLALEYVEQRVLDGRSADAGSSRIDIEISDELAAQLVPRTFAAGQIVTTQGAPGDSMFVVLSGSMTVCRLGVDGSRRRLRRFGAGGVIGEIGMLNGGIRSAEVVADNHAEVLEISRIRYDQLRVERPELIFELHEYIMRSQADRIVSLSEGLVGLDG